MKKLPIRERIAARISLMRQRGKTPLEIGRYARQQIAQFKLSAEDLELLAEEVRFTQPTLPEMAAKQKKLAAKNSWVRETAAPLPPKKSLTKGMGPKAVCEALGCSMTELNRWEKSGALPADGEKYNHGVGVQGGGKWGRAWLPSTVEDAKLKIQFWRDQHTIRTIARKKPVHMIE